MPDYLIDFTCIRNGGADTGTKPVSSQTPMPTDPAFAQQNGLADIVTQLVADEGVQVSNVRIVSIRPV